MPRPTQLIVTEGQRQQKADVSSQLSDAFGQMAYRKQKAMQRVDEARLQDPRSLAKEALKQARAEVGDLGRDVVRRRAKELFERMQGKLSRSVSAQKTAMAEAEEMGHGKRLADIRRAPEDLEKRYERAGKRLLKAQERVRAATQARGTAGYDPARMASLQIRLKEANIELDRARIDAQSIPDKYKRGLAGEALFKLGKTTRPLAGGIGGAASSLAEAAERIERPAGEVRELPQPLVDRLATVLKLKRQVGDAAAAGALRALASEFDMTPQDIAASVTQQIPRSGLSDTLAALSGAETTVLGVPVARAAKAFAQAPGEVAGQAFQRAGRRAAKVYETTQLEVPEDLTASLGEEAKRRFAAEALSEAKQQLGADADRDQIRQRARALFEGKMEQSFAVRHPLITSLGVEAVGDPLHLSPMAAARTAGKVAAATPVVGPHLAQAGRAVKRVGLDLTAGFRHMPVYDEMRHLGGAETKLMSQLGELAEAEATGVRDYIDKLYGRYVRTLDEVTDPTERALLYETATGQRPAESLPEHLQPYLEVHRALEVRSRVLRNTTGISQDFDQIGILRDGRIWDPEEYAPGRVLKPNVTEDFMSDPLGGPGPLTRLKDTKSKTMGPEDFEPDLGKQWTAKLKSLETKAGRAYEMKALKRYLSDPKVEGIIEVSSAAPPEKAARVLQREWVNLVKQSGKLSDGEQRLLGQANAYRERAQALLEQHRIAQRLPPNQQPYVIQAAELQRKAAKLKRQAEAVEAESYLLSTRTGQETLAQSAKAEGAVGAAVQKAERVSEGIPQRVRGVEHRVTGVDVKGDVLEGVQAKPIREAVPTPERRPATAAAVGRKQERAKDAARKIAQTQDEADEALWATLTEPEMVRQQKIDEAAKMREKASQLQAQADDILQTRNIDADVLNELTPRAGARVQRVRAKVGDLMRRAAKAEEAADAALWKRLVLRSGEDELKGNIAMAQRAEARIAQAQAEATAKAAEMTQKTGVSWVVLEPSVQRAWQSTTGRAGQKLGDTLTVMPRDVAQRIIALHAVDGTKDVHDFITMARKLNTYAFRPMQKVWRIGKTLPAPAFHAKNALGSLALSHIAFGLRAANPGLQGGAAMTALLAAGWGSKRAANLNFTLKSGQQVKLGELAKLLNRVGLGNQVDLYLGYEMLGKGPLAAAATGVERLAKFDVPGLRWARGVSPEAVARATDNYQHAVAFIGALDSTAPADIARALDFASKFSGNYRRLGKYEQVIKEAFGFYAWTRFIFPHIVTQLAENPHRIATWVRLKRAAELQWGGAAPFEENAVPSYIFSGFTSPLSAQPKLVQEYVKTGVLPDISSHRFATTVLEDPAAMGLALLPLLAKTAGIEEGTPEARETLVGMLGPLAQATLELLFKRDIQTGAQKKEIFPFPFADETWEQYENRLQASHLGDFALGYIDRSILPWIDMVRLYKDYFGEGPEYARRTTELKLQYAMGRYFLGLDNTVLGLMGMEGLSKGGMFDVEGGGIPGGSTLLIDPAQSFSMQKYKAQEGMKERQYQLQRRAPAMEFITE